MGVGRMDLIGRAVRAARIRKARVPVVRSANGGQDDRAGESWGWAECATPGQSCGTDLLAARRRPCRGLAPWLLVRVPAAVRPGQLPHRPSSGRGAASGPAFTDRSRAPRFPEQRGRPGASGPIRPQLTGRPPLSPSVEQCGAQFVVDGCSRKGGASSAPWGGRGRSTTRVRWRTSTTRTSSPARSFAGVLVTARQRSGPHRTQPA